MLGEHISPQSEVIRAILFEDSPCCAVPHLHLLDLLLQLLDPLHRRVGSGVVRPHVVLDFGNR